MKKVLNERLVSYEEFLQIKEDRKRRFRVNYFDGIIRTDKIFQSKKYVKNLLSDPHISKVKIYVGDVIVE